jgi:uncharacterized protein YdiU (UPF0061 family)
MLNFENSFYHQFSLDFYQKINPQNFPKADLAYFNDDLVQELNLSKKDLKKSQIQEIYKEIFSGQKIHSTSIPIALAYAGHQFGNFVSQLGDGRAILLGEIVSNAQRFDVQLKGSGPTKFSRNGDGLMTLGSAIRELIIGEALHYLQIPATRILTLCITNESVYRQEVNMGAVIARVAKSHIRVGTFEYFASRGNNKAIQQLCEYVINRHFPQENTQPKSLAKLFNDIVFAQANLIAKLQANGFIHGVMNSDNMAISGQAIDFGPCAFLDEYNSKKVFSAIDRDGRYAYANQGKIAKWNLWILANCLSLIHKNSQELLEILDLFENEFDEKYQKIMAKKFGFEKQIPQKLIADFLEILQQKNCDYQQSFFNLSDDLLCQKPRIIKDEEYYKWFLSWQNLLQQEYDLSDKNILKKIAKKMRSINPFIIARNHIVQEVIEAGNNLDFKPLENFLEVLKNPFNYDEKNIFYHTPPSNSQKVLQTFCGT